MGGDEGLTIRDLGERTTGPQWLPPANAMGGPPAADLYRELVLHAELRLYRDDDRRAWLAFKDGEHRRLFHVPSRELTSALDRFRMRRNMRPLPEKDIAEFVRVVRARISDPDARIPNFQFRAGRAGASVGGGPPRSSLPDPESPTSSAWESPAPSDAGETEASRTVRSPYLSGGVVASIGTNSTAKRYAESLRELVRHGGWLGGIVDLSRQLGEDPETVFENLLQHQADLAELGVVVGQVEVDGEWRWLAIDRSWVPWTTQPESPGAIGARPET
jgi:hypothetical protein